MTAAIAEHVRSKTTPPFDAARLDRLMEEADIDVLFVTSRHNLFYLLGGYRFFFFDVMEAIGLSRYLPILVYPRGKPERAFYIGNGMERFENELGRIWAPVVRTEAWGTSDAVRLAIEQMAKLGTKVSRIGIEPSFLPADAHAVLVAATTDATLVDANVLLERLRAVKSAGELKIISEASERVIASMRATFDQCAPGMTKRDIVDILRREEQSRGLVFEYCLITAGTSLNRAPSDQRLEAGDIFSLDSGATYGGYIGDLSRMGIIGEPDSELTDLLAEVEAVQQAARKPIRAGAIGGEIIEAGDAVMRQSSHAAYMEFTGHGVGVVLHEAPRLADRRPVIYPPSDAAHPLQTGMVLSLETAIRHPKRGYVKLEDTLVVTADGWTAYGDHYRGWNRTGTNTKG